METIFGAWAATGLGQRRRLILLRRGLLGGGLQAALAFAPGDLCGQGVEAAHPQAPELLKPSVYGLKRRRAQRIQSPRAIRAHGHKARLPQHTEVLGDRWLREAELIPEDLGEAPRGPLTLGEQL